MKNWPIDRVDEFKPFENQLENLGEKLWMMRGAIFSVEGWCFILSGLPKNPVIKTHGCWTIWVKHCFVGSSHVFFDLLTFCNFSLDVLTWFPNMLSFQSHKKMLSVVKGLMFFAPILAKDPCNYQLGDWRRERKPLESEHSFLSTFFLG